MGKYSGKELADMCASGYFPVSIQELRKWYDQFSKDNDLPTEQDQTQDMLCSKFTDLSGTEIGVDLVDSANDWLESLAPQENSESSDDEPESLKDVSKLIRKTCKALKKERKFHLKQISLLRRLLDDDQ